MCEHCGNRGCGHCCPVPDTDLAERTFTKQDDAALALRDWRFSSGE